MKAAEKPVGSDNSGVNVVPFDRLSARGFGAAGFQTLFMEPDGSPRHSQRAAAVYHMKRALMCVRRRRAALLNVFTRTRREEEEGGGGGGGKYNKLLSLQKEAY